jgi:hypothetical protein
LHESYRLISLALFQHLGDDLPYALNRELFDARDMADQRARSSAVPGSAASDPPLRAASRREDGLRERRERLLATGVLRTLGH